MRALVIAGSLALVSSSCATTKKTKTVKNMSVVSYFETPAIGKRTTQQYKDPIEEGMFDPDASLYRNVKYYSPKLKGKKITVMCGKFNAKNKMGGYIGYKRFVSDGVRGNIESYYKNEVIDCMCRNGEIALKCQTSTVTVKDNGASVGAHCWSWLFFPYGGGWWWLKCY